MAGRSLADTHQQTRTPGRAPWSVAARLPWSSAARLGRAAGPGVEAGRGAGPAVEAGRKLHRLKTGTHMPQKLEVLRTLGTPGRPALHCGRLPSAAYTLIPLPAPVKQKTVQQNGLWCSSQPTHERTVCGRRGKSQV